MKRFRERVGYILTESAYDELKMKTRESGVFLYRRHKVDEFGAAYGVKFRNMHLKVVYDVFSGTLITVLPMHDSYGSVTD